MEDVRTADLGPGIIGQLSQALMAAGTVIDALPGPSFRMATPCPGWTVLDVVNHLGAVTDKFGRFAAGGDQPIHQLQGDLVGADPAQGFRQVVDVAITAWADHPEALDAVCVLPFGRFDGATAAGINVFDAVVHQWDIAVGAGVRVDLSDELALVALRVADLLVTAEAQGSGHYAAPGVPPADAGPLGRLLAATGRQLDTEAPRNPEGWNHPNTD